MKATTAVGHSPAIQEQFLKWKEMVDTLIDSRAPTKVKKAEKGSDNQSDLEVTIPEIVEIIEAVEDEALKKE